MKYKLLGISLFPKQLCVIQMEWNASKLSGIIPLISFTIAFFSLYC